MAAPGYYTATDLIESAKVRCLVPVDEITFKEEDLLRFANEEIQNTLLPYILKLKEEFYVVREYLQTSPTQLAYPIPYRAIGGKLRQLFFNNTPNRSGIMTPLTRIQPEDMNYTSFHQGTDVSKFYVENDSIVFPAVEGSMQTGYVEMSYYLRPNKLVKASRVGIIADIDRTNGIITISNSIFPSNLVVGTQVDFLQAKPMYKNHKWDVNIVAVNTTTKQITLATTDIPDALVVGDLIATAGETIIPQIPTELMSFLSQSIAMRILEAQGDIDNYKAAAEKLKQMGEGLVALIDSRTEGNPQKFNNNNKGILQQSLSSYRRRRRW
jgi:hypothetical protein